MEFWVFFSPAVDSIPRLGSIHSEEMAVTLAEKYPEAIYFQAELISPSSRYNRIRELEEKGVLGREECPELDYWHWPVLLPEHLPLEFMVDYELFGEIRYY